MNELQQGKLEFEALVQHVIRNDTNISNEIAIWTKIINSHCAISSDQVYDMVKRCYEEWYNDQQKELARIGGW